MTHKIPAKVHMLKTSRLTEVVLWKLIGHTELHFGKSDIAGAWEEGFIQCQHLYITTDDKINNGDCYYNKRFVQRVAKNEGDTKIEDKGSIDNWYKKIVGTTNPDLDLPIIPTSFVEKYCDANGIDNVQISLGSFMSGQCSCSCHTNPGTIHFAACCNPKRIFTINIF